MPSSPVIPPLGGPREAFTRPLYLMAKPAGPHCNLRCQYCYYLEKEKLYPDDKRHIMSDELLHEFIRQYIEAQTQPEILFTWHGGEPLMRPLSFYRRAIELQRYYGAGRIISNCIQTNGTLLTDEWCQFFHDEGWLVGISIDGPQAYHDAYRRTADRRPTWHKVCQGIKLLQKHHVEWNAMAVVNNLNVEHPLEFYHFFRDNGCQYLQFAPIVERLTTHTDGRWLAETEPPQPPSFPPGGEDQSPSASDSVPVSASVQTALAVPSPNTDPSPSSPLGGTEGGSLSPQSITPQQWGTFLCAIFDEWVRRDVGTMFVELFDCTLANWVGQQPGICIYARDCGHAGVMEYNGDVYSCDHFVFPKYRLGNIRQQTITEMLYGPQQTEFSHLKHGSLPPQCLSCQYEFACHGECPKNRFLTDAQGHPGLNYLCQGYHQFYQHVAPYMDFMANELAQQRPPANVMNVIL